MTFKEKVVVRILLLVAKLIADEGWKKDIEALSTHVVYSSEGR